MKKKPNLEKIKLVKLTQFTNARLKIQPQIELTAKSELFRGPHSNISKHKRDPGGTRSSNTSCQSPATEIQLFSVLNILMHPMALKDLCNTFLFLNKTH